MANDEDMVISCYIEKLNIYRYMAESYELALTPDR